MDMKATLDSRKAYRLDHLRMVLVAIQKHPHFNVQHPQNSSYPLHFLWEFLHRTRYMLKQIDSAQLYSYDEQTMMAFAITENRISRAREIITNHGMHDDPNVAVVDLGDEVRAASEQLEANRSLDEFAQDMLKCRDSFPDWLTSPLVGQEPDLEAMSNGEANEPEAGGARRDVPRSSRCPLMELPRETRDQIYKYLLSTDYAKTPPAHPLICKPARFKWRLHTAILRTNEGIFNEARDVLGRENRFVVLERATQRLTQRMDEKPDATYLHILDPPLWPGKAKSQVCVPGEVMRIEFSGEDGSMIDYFVCLPEELRDIFVKLGLLRTGVVFRPRGLSCAVTLTVPKSSETEATTKRRESALLDPLTKLRQLSKVTITGASDDKAQDTMQQMKRMEFSAEDALRTIDEILGTIDAYTRAGSYDIARTYSEWCTLILAFFRADVPGLTGVVPNSVFIAYGDRKRINDTLLRMTVNHALCCLQSGQFGEARRIMLPLILSTPWLPDLIITLEGDGRAQQKVPDVIDDADTIRLCCYEKLAAVSRKSPDEPVLWDTVTVSGSDDNPLVVELRTLIRDLEQSWDELGGGRWRDRRDREPSNMGMFKGSLHSVHMSRMVWKQRDIPSYDKAWQRPLAPLVKITEAAHLESIDLRL